MVCGQAELAAALQGDGAVGQEVAVGGSGSSVKLVGHGGVSILIRIHTARPGAVAIHILGARAERAEQNKRQG